MTADSARPQRLIGKGEARRPEGLKDFGHYAKGLGTPPKKALHFREVQHWPVDGNYKYGDCSMAAAVHLMQLWNTLSLQTDPVPPASHVVSEYLTLCGGKDTGLVEADVLKTWHGQGLWGNRICGYAPVAVRNIELLQQLIHAFGGVFTGVRLPESADTQFEQGKPWSLEGTPAHDKLTGGHAVPLVGYDERRFFCVTWGKVQAVEYDWWLRHGDEAWALLPQQFREAGGFDGLDYEQLQADLARIR